MSHYDHVERRAEEPDFGGVIIGLTYVAFLSVVYGSAYLASLFRWGSTILGLAPVILAAVLWILVSWVNYRERRVIARVRARRGVGMFRRARSWFVAHGWRKLTREELGLVGLILGLVLSQIFFAALRFFAKR